MIGDFIAGLLGEFLTGLGRSVFRRRKKQPAPTAVRPKRKKRTHSPRRRKR